MHLAIDFEPRPTGYYPPNAKASHESQNRTVNYTRSHRRCPEHASHCRTWFFTQTKAVVSVRRQWHPGATPCCHTGILLRQSAAILDSAIAGITNARPDIVLIPGDLTKDGELVSHQAVAEVLRRLRDAGIKVFVCPGNHDIANPEAVAFDGADVSPVPSVTPGEFASFYAEFGYGNASFRDPNSLSYVAEPVPGLRILAMDVCRYDRNTNNTSFVGGYFDSARWNWITNQLDQARAQGKLVIGMMHHRVTEHYLGQKMLFPEYVVDDYEFVRETFAHSAAVQPALDCSSTVRSSSDRSVRHALHR
ncbi:MAG: metallophosphoesterase family protein [Verrucomicrobiia bacterium]